MDELSVEFIDRDWKCQNFPLRFWEKRSALVHLSLRKCKQITFTLGLCHWMEISEVTELMWAAPVTLRIFSSGNILWSWWVLHKGLWNSWRAEPLLDFQTLRYWVTCIYFLFSISLSFGTFPYLITCRIAFLLNGHRSIASRWIEATEVGCSLFMAFRVLLVHILLAWWWTQITVAYLSLFLAMNCYEYTLMLLGSFLIKFSSFKRTVSDTESVSIIRGKEGKILTHLVSLKRTVSTKEPRDLNRLTFRKVMLTHPNRCTKSDVH
jgi:hypothetical protein